MTAARPLPQRLPRPSHLPKLLVVGMHALLLWGLLQLSGTPRPAQTVVTAQLLTVPTAPQIERPAPPKPEPTKPQPSTPNPSPLRTAKPAVAPSPAPPMPLAQESPAPAAITAPAPATAQPDAAAALPPAATAPAKSAKTAEEAPPPPKLELPSTNASYLNNPKPNYPAMSKRLQEQGKVMVRVLIEADGSPSRAEIHTSSGFDRLDQAALQTVLRWRFVPGKRAGVPEAMWFNVPINFVLE